MQGSETDADSRGQRLLGVVAILSGASFLAHLAVVVTLPAVPTGQDLQVYSKNQGIYEALFFSVVAFAVFAIPFVGGLGRVLSPRSSKIASAASLVTASGILVIVLGVVLSVGALDAISSALSGPTYQASAAFEASFWGNMQSLTNLFGDFLSGIGMLLFGWLAWRSGILPDWLAVVGLVGGAASFLAPFAEPLGLVSLGAFTAWSIATGVILLRPGATIQAATAAGK